MKKEKTVKSHTRKTKSGKVVVVRQHKAKYDASEKEKLLKKKGAGEELENIRLSKEETPLVELPFTADEFKEWYQGTGSATDKKVAKALRSMLGRSGYRKLEDDAIDNYTPRGYNKMFKKLSMDNTPKKETAKVSTTPTKTVSVDAAPKVSWKHTSGKSQELDFHGQANYSGITSSGVKLSKKFTYDSDTHSANYDSFVSKNSDATRELVEQVRKLKWQKSGGPKLSRYISPDGRTHLIVNKEQKIASIFYR